MPRVASLSALLLAVSCAPIEDVREQEIVDVVVRADEPLLRARPALVASKYRAMQGSLFSFYRGTFPLYLHDTAAGHVGDASSFDVKVFPFTIGDAHPENFGTLLAADGTLGFEPNDFDGADRYPYLWDVRRLAIGLVVGARDSNPDDPDARKVARASEHDYAQAAALGYAEEIHRLARGGARERFTAPTSAFLIDLFKRANKDLASRDELAGLTVMTNGRRRLLRGVLDEADPENTTESVSDTVATALPGTLGAYRQTLPVALPKAFFELKDAAREYGSGVASRPRVRILLLVEGPTTSLDDDVILELKEIADSGAPPVAEPSVSADDVGGRIRHALESCWTTRSAEPLWGTSTLLGLPVQIRAEREAHKTVRVARMKEELGTPEAITDLATELGQTLARIHAGSEASLPGTISAIDLAIGDDRAAFADEQTAVALEYADVVEGDYARFRDALDTLGPTLGFRNDTTDAPDADLAALYGTPPEVTP